MMYLNEREQKELVTRAVESSGIEPRELQKRMWRALWSLEKLSREMQTEGWTERMDAAGTVADVERERQSRVVVEKAVLAIFAGGPIAMAQMTAADRLKAIQRPVRWVADTYVPEQHGGLVVLGPTGIGKTLSVMHAIDRIVRPVFAGTLEEVHTGSGMHDRDIQMRVTRVSPFVWFRAYEIGKARRGHPLGEGEPEILKKAIKAPIAVIDDLGWEDTRDTAVTEIVAERYEAKRPTIITSGLRPEEIETRYGAAFLRRIVDGDPKGRIVNGFPKEAMQ